MTDSPSASTEGAFMTTAQIETIADGLYLIATLGGVHEQELEIVKTFLRDAGHVGYVDQLGARSFEVEEAVTVLNTQFLRRLFIKAAILLVRADHVVTTEERDLLEFLARAFGLLEELGALEQEVDGQTLD